PERPSGSSNGSAHFRHHSRRVGISIRYVCSTHRRSWLSRRTPTRSARTPNASSNTCATAHAASPRVRAPNACGRVLARNNSLSFMALLRCPTVRRLSTVRGSCGAAGTRRPRRAGGRPEAGGAIGGAGRAPPRARRAAGAREGRRAPRSARSGTAREVLRPHQDLPRLRAVAGADDAVLLHEIDEPGGLRVAESHPPLDEADRGLLLAHDQLDRAPVGVVALRLAAALVAALLPHRLEQALLVHGLPLRAQEAHHLADLGLGHPGPVDAPGARRPRGHEEHVAPPEELLGAVLVEDRPRVDLARDLE